MQHLRRDRQDVAHATAFRDHLARWEGGMLGFGGSGLQMVNDVGSACKRVAGCCSLWRFAKSQDQHTSIGCVGGNVN